jgi:predicted enzyme related to lactoylglutathione lyase
MPRVVHFEIHADQPERAVQFYSTIFNWQFHKFEGGWDYWLIKTGEAGEPGIDGRLLQRQCPVDGQAVTAYVCTVDVASVDETAVAIEAAGGTVALPKMPIPGVGWLAYFKDTEGNVFGTMQSDPTAAA